MTDDKLYFVLKNLCDSAQVLSQAGRGHYSHWDPEGKAGLACPACTEQREAAEVFAPALREARKALRSLR
jgi:hypothetical protein